MKKWLSLITFTILLISSSLYALSFLGTFSSSKTENVEKPNKTNPIVLTFWRNNGNAAENRAYEKLVSSFEAAHPAIKVHMKSFPYSDYEIRLRTELATGNPPDVLTIDSPTLALYANTGSLSSLDSYMRNEGNIEDIPESTLKGMSFQGDIYLAPLVESSIALFYNKRLFKKAGIPFPSGDPNKPMTWEEVLQIAKKLTHPEKGSVWD